MIEYRLILDDEQQPGRAPPEEPPRRLSRRWFLLLGLVILLAAGFFVLQRLRAERRAALQADLITLIRAEEAARLEGEPDRAADFALPATPAGWQAAYQQTFGLAPLAAPPRLVELDRVDFDGRCAVVRARLDGQAQVRAACLAPPGGWRRIPAPAALWSGEFARITLAGGTRLDYWPPDEEFAARLAGDLPSVLARIDGWQPVARPLHIVIEPHDQQPPLVADEAEQIVLNSPLLTPFGHGPLPSGQIGVRLALAQALLNRANLAPAAPGHPLPGAARFSAAGQTVLAAHLILAPAAQTRLVEAWQAQLAGEWVSPFFADWAAAPTPIAAARADLAAYLTAETVYRLKGPDVLAALLRQIPAASAWDPLFLAALGRSTVTLEDEAAGLARGEPVGDIPGGPPPSGRPSFRATFLHFEAGPPDTVVSAGPSGPVRVELPSGLALTAAGDQILPPGCVPAGAELDVEGDWLEVGRRLQASRVVVRDGGLFKIELPPADTVAYLAEGVPPGDPALAAQTVFPSNRSFFIAGGLLVPQRLVALRRDGSLRPLAALSSTLRVVSLPVAAGQKVHFLWQLDLPGCDRRWFVHFEPAGGITGQWLSPPQPVQWVWRPDPAGLLFFHSGPGQTGQSLYRAGDLVPDGTVSQFDQPVLFTGWHVETGQLVFTRTWMGATGIGLLDPASGRMRRLKLFIHPLRARRLSPDGNWLAYLVGVKNLFDPPYRLDLLNLDDLAETTLLAAAAGSEGIGPPEWSPYLSSPQLAVLTGPLAPGGSLRPSRLLVASPGRPGPPAVVVEAGPGEQLALPVFCGDGRLLYRVESDGQYRLERRRPGERPEILLTRESPFLPFACP